MQGMWRFSLFLAVLGCSPCEEVTEWSIPVFNPALGEHVGADARAAVMTDGTTVVAIAGLGTTQFGGHVVEAPSVATVTSGGVVDRLEVVPDAMSLARVRSTGDGVVVEVVGTESMRFIRYDGNLAVMSDQAFSEFVLAWDVGRGGQMAVVSSSGIGFHVRYFTADGREPWRTSLSASTIYGVAVLDTGEVQVFDSLNDLPARETLAAADGTITASIEVPSSPLGTGPDGTSLFDSYRTSTTVAIDAKGDTRWAQDFGGPTAQAVWLDGGDIAVSMGIDRSTLIRLDAASGEERHRVDCCNVASPIGGDATGVVTLGMSASTSQGLARYALPH